MVMVCRVLPISVHQMEIVVIVLIVYRTNNDQVLVNVSVIQDISMMEQHFQHV